MGFKKHSYILYTFLMFYACSREDLVNRRMTVQVPGADARGIDKSDKLPPEPPSSVSGIALGAYRVGINWSEAPDDRGIRAYRVYRQGVFLTEVAASALSYEDAGLEASMSYSYEVTAVDFGDNESKKSIAVSITTPAPGGAELYDAHCAGCHGSLEQSSKRDRTAEQISDAITNLEIMKHLRKSLEAVDIESIAQSLSTIKKDNVPPIAPGGVEGAVLGPSSIALRWSTPAADPAGGSGLDYLRVYRNSRFLTEIAKTSMSFSDQGLEPNTNYVYELTALDAAGNESSRSAAVTVKTALSPVGVDTTAPTAPQIVDVQVLSATSTRLRWLNVNDNAGGSGLAGYMIYRNGSVVKRIDPAALEFIDRNLTERTVLRYEVSAVDAVGNESTRSAIREIATPAADGVALYHTNCQNCHDVLANSTKKGRSAQLIFSSIATVESMKFLAEQLGTDDVAAISRALSTMTDNVAPTPPNALRLTGSGTRNVDLTWDASTDGGGSGLKGYRIYRQGIFITGISNTRTYSDRGLTPGTSYSYEVSAIDAANNESSRSAALNVQTLSETMPDKEKPSPPSGLRVLNAMAREATIVWSPSSDTGGSGLATYRILRNGEAASEVMGTVLSWTDKNLNPQSRYFFSIQAIDGAGNISDPSATLLVDTPALDGRALYTANCTGAGCHGSLDASTKKGRTADQIKGAIAAVPQMAGLKGLGSQDIMAIAMALAPQPDTIPPTVPAGLQAVALSYERIQLTWTASTDQGGSGVAGYRVFRSGTMIASTVADNPVYVDQGLAENASFSYTVVAVDGTGNISTASAPVSVRTPAKPLGPDTVAPSAPTGVSASATSYRLVRVSWSPSTDSGGSGLRGYRVLRDGAFIGGVLSPTTYFDDRGVIGGKSYIYRIVAYDGAGLESQGSQLASVLVPVLDGAALYKANCESCHGLLTSSRVKDRTADQIDRAIDLVPLMSGLTGLQSDELNALAVVLKTAPDLIAPSVPSRLTATAVSYQRVDLQWEASTDMGGAGIDGYIIYRNNVSMSKVSGVSYGDSGLSARTNYTYKIVAIDRAGNQSAASFSVSVTTPDQPAMPDTTAPTVPVGLKAAAQSPTAVRLTWVASTDSGGSGLSRYRIFRNEQYIGQISAPSTAFLDSGCSPSTMYSYRVSAVDASSATGLESSRSEPASITTPALDGAALYRSTCASSSCHKPLEESDKRGVSAAMIMDAISNQPAMKGRSALTALKPAEISAIAAALKVDTNPSQNLSAFGYAVPQGTRHYLASRLRSLFLGGPDPTGLIESRITALIVQQAPDFGGACTRYDSTCFGGVLNQDANANASMSPGVNAARSGYQMRACEELVARDDATRNALGKAALSVTSLPTATNMQKLFAAMFPGRTAPSDVSAALATLAKETEAIGKPRIDGWRIVIYSLCESVEFGSF